MLLERSHRMWYFIQGIIDLSVSRMLIEQGLRRIGGPLRVTVYLLEGI